MSNFKLSTRLFLGFGLVLALLAVMVGTSAWQMYRLADNSNFYAVNVVPSLRAQYRMGIDLGNIRRFEYRHLLSNSESQMDGLEAKIAGYRKNIVDDLDLYAKDLLADAEDKQLLQEARTAIEAYLAVWDKQLKAVSRQTAQDPAKNEQATAIVTGPSAKAYEEAHAALQAWFDYNIRLSNHQAKLAESTYSSARAMLFSLAALAAVLGLAAAVAITRSITRPVAQAVHVAQAVAAGDLSVRVDATARDETGQLLAALKGMTEKLSHVVGAVRNGSDSVATASAEIAQGNQDLSGRTEEQASALEETAATMEQLGGTVRHNADSAAQANQLARAAADVATQGGNVVHEVVNTMQGISESSRKIGDIIGVIDSIAFQTNILALNAAVEAARAGEQGRGFAVVAGEVRTLAQRSAEAAKEIKGLITSNVEQVEQGTVLVDKAGKTMDEIVGSIKRVSDIVGEISAATTEQSNGIQQVGESVSQMDQVTQQNAALVEQSAAAAESLKHQAQQLVEAVSFFKLAGGAGLDRPATMAEARPLALQAVQRAQSAARRPSGQPASAASALAPAGGQALQAPRSRTAAVSDSEEWTAF